MRLGPPISKPRSLATRLFHFPKVRGRSGKTYRAAATNVPPNPRDLKTLPAVVIFVRILILNSRGRQISYRTEDPSPYQIDGRMPKKSSRTSRIPHFGNGPLHKTRLSGTDGSSNSTPEV